MSNGWLYEKARRAWRRVRPGHRTFQLAHPDALTVGRHTYFSPGTIIRTWAPSERIRIGSFCSISEEVRILHPGEGETLHDATGAPTRLRLRGNHRFAAATTFPIGILMPPGGFDEIPVDGSLQSRPLVIGNDVWIGYRAMVLGAVTIGDGAVIAAGSVVLSDVPAYALVAGNPAKVVRHRFSASTIAALERLAWWAWPDEQILENAEWLMRPIGEFVAQFGDAPPDGPASTETDLARQRVDDAS
jgi:acetyltransferase-like isoleucine patch superfamily enzyme